MGKARHLTLVAILLSLSGGYVFSDEMRTHVVEVGDTLSHIAKKYLPPPIYAPDIGGIAQIIRANPQIKDPHRIFPGMVINVPMENEATLPRRLASSDSPVASSLPTATPAPVSQAATPVPQVLPAPQALPVAQPDHSGPDPMSYVSAKSDFTFFVLDATDEATGSKSTFLSGMSPEVHLTWKLDWTEKWSSFMASDIQSYSILGDVGTNPRQMDNGAGNRFGFRFGVLRNWHEGNRTGLVLGFKEMLFVRTPTPTSVAFDKIGTPSLHLVQELDLFKVKSAKAGLAISAGLLLPGRGQTYSTNSGYSGAIDLYIRHSFKRLSLVGSGRYEMLEQNSTLIKKTETQVGAGVGVEWKLGD